MPSERRADEAFDLIVLGSGAGGLTAALVPRSRACARC